MAKKKDKRELGKGIRALLSHIEESKEPSSEEIKSYQELSILEIDVDAIEVNPFQPRNDFDETSLNELASSLRTYGLIQPITVRSVGQGRYQLISGERRLRAARIAGMDVIPAFIRVADDQGMLEMALIENVQRADLNAVEVAISLKRLIDECDLTHEKLSDRIGKDRSTVTNYLRLLKLPPEIQRSIKSKKISMGHARAIAGLGDIDRQLHVFKQVLQKDLSVRGTEKLIRDQSSPSVRSHRRVISLSPEFLKIQDRLSQYFGRKVVLDTNAKGKGKITISFNSVDELNDILDIIDD